ncbi:MAG: NADH-ubiquinone oxidoreductase-F iron-sulfur binding region domain-containing protein [Candidatus Calescibacterium sp.]|nr:NAD(P)H-dependent oxidoreductase subunit E [Candidatus Calescibacterium sp.]MCX7972002.1 NAD(P)H-dependent oxidoreductase subunit E [bacterium]MDW8195490.1 NADH-ubiquinone oxidoreductase-F iron-sulfur binding region domain-containing protein [Candidatus Calescibacterium sp.]
MMESIIYPNNSKLIELLFDKLENKGEISHEDIAYISKLLDIPINEVSSIASFYKEFSTAKTSRTIYVCFGISCVERGSKEIFQRLKESGFDVRKSYCFKKCAQSPVVKLKDRYILKFDPSHLSENIYSHSDSVKDVEKNITTKQKIRIKRCIAGNCLYHRLDIDPEIFEVKNCGCLGFCGYAPVGIVNDKVYNLNPKFLEDLKNGNDTTNYPYFHFDKQNRIITRNNDIVDPYDIDTYISAGGFEALRKALNMKKEEIIEIAKEAGIRGRGGAAFPLHIKLKGVSEQKDFPKYVVANLEEGEISSFCNTILAESNPFIIIEGMIIAGYVVNASYGFIFVNYKASEAIERLENAILQARDKGFLGKITPDWEFDIELRRSPSAYVAGEETAMLEVIEGKKAMPRNRPPFPFQKGLFGKPTLINNVETLAALVCAVLYGPEEFKKFGTQNSVGTKMISLTGNVNNPCVTEVPYNITLEEIIQYYGRGFRGENKGFLIGGPSGGILNNEFYQIRYTYEDIQKTGAMLGSGAIFAIPNNMSVVELVRDLMEFFADESCGQCIPCRVGTTKLKEILDNILKGNRIDEKLEQIAETVMNASLCGLGQAAPIPLLTAMKYFKDEFKT